MITSVSQAFNERIYVADELFKKKEKIDLTLHDFHQMIQILIKLTREQVREVLLRPSNAWLE